MTLTSNKIRVYTNGVVHDGTGAYAYIVLEDKDLSTPAVASSVRIGLSSPSLLRAKFAQAGKSDSAVRMKMRAAYEGVRHCPDGRAIAIYTDEYLLQGYLDDEKLSASNNDIASKYRTYIVEHKLDVTFLFAETYKKDDFPDNDHDEWTWWAHSLCEDAIKRRAATKPGITYEELIQNQLTNKKK